MKKSAPDTRRRRGKLSNSDVVGGFSNLGRISVHGRRIHPLLYCSFVPSCGSLFLSSATLRTSSVFFPLIFFGDMWHCGIGVFLIEMALDI